MKRRKAYFFIDGFNLYHSIRAAEKQLPNTQLKWLDIPKLCRSYVPLFGKDVDLGEIHYFSAYADHLQNKEPDKPERHRKFVRALTASGVIAHIGRFQKKRVWAHKQAIWVDAYEEKETDVAIACEVLSLARRDALDVAVILTGDSDFSPLARAFKNDFPGKEILFALPFARATKELKQICPCDQRAQANLPELFHDKQGSLRQTSTPRTSPPTEQKVRLNSKGMESLTFQLHPLDRRNLGEGGSN